MSGHVHRHTHAPAAFGRAFAVGIVLNLAYVAAEAAWGVAANSLALIADAGHNFGDILSLAWARDGTRIAFSVTSYGGTAEFNGLHIVTMRARQDFWTLLSEPGMAAPSNLEWAPDGSKVALTVETRPRQIRQAITFPPATPKMCWPAISATCCFPIISAAGVLRKNVALIAT